MLKKGRRPTSRLSLFVQFAHLSFFRAIPSHFCEFQNRMPCCLAVHPVFVTFNATDAAWGCKRGFGRPAANPEEGADPRRVWVFSSQAVAGSCGEGNYDARGSGELGRPTRPRVSTSREVAARPSAPLSNSAGVEEPEGLYHDCRTSRARQLFDLQKLQTHRRGLLEHLTSRS